MKSKIIAAMFVAALAMPSVAFAKCAVNIPNLPKMQPIADTLFVKGAKMPNQRVIVYENKYDYSTFYVVFQNKKTCGLIDRKMTGQQIFDEIGISGFVEGDENYEGEGD